MKKLLLIFVVLLFATSIFSTKTISDVNVNTPVPLGEFLTVRGNYINTDNNRSVFCKFLMKNEGIVVERLTDERTFANGDFYAQRKLQEPIYKRDNNYTIKITCETTSQDANFIVAQRTSIEHIAQQEALFLFQRGNMDAIMQIGIAVLFFVGFIIFLVFFVRQAFK